jgi:hypothetical protein
MKLNYQDALKRIKTIAGAHSLVYSVDDGRELEFDTKRKNQWPRVFIRTDQSNFIGGEGTVVLTVTYTLLVMDKVKSDRSNIVEVMGKTHGIMTDILATMNKEQLIRLTDNGTLTPLYDYQDTQSSGWQIPVNVYLDIGFECYEVPE